MTINTGAAGNKTVTVTGTGAASATGSITTTVNYKFYTDLAEERYHVLNITTSSSVLNVVKVSQSGTGYGNAPGVVFKDGKWILATYYNYFGMDQESSFTGTVTLDIVTSTGTFRVVTPSLTIHYAYL